MTRNQKLMEDLDRERSRVHKADNYAWLGLILATISLLYGEFIVRVDGFFLQHTEPYFKWLPENFIGILLMAAGLIKLIGVLTRNKRLKRYGIWALCGLWWGMVGIAWGYSFGSGYPHPSWIYMLGYALICSYEARRGVFY